MTETELEYQFCFNCDDRKQCYTKPKDCTRIQEEIGLQEMTNEEYIKSLNTEQLAEFLFRIAYMCSYCGDEAHSTEEKTQKCHFGKCYCQRQDWEMWLKQPHKDTK